MDHPAGRREAAAPVGHHAASLGLADRGAQVRSAGEAGRALAAFRNVERDHMVAEAQRTHARADFGHHARSLMAEDRRKKALGVLARERVSVGMTYATRLDLDQHLALSGSVEIDGLDLERGAGLVCDSRLDLHANAPAMLVQISAQRR